MYQIKMLVIQTLTLKNREELTMAKVYPTKQKKFLPILTKNKAGEKMSEFYVPTIFNKLPDDIWDVKGYGELKRIVNNYYIKKQSG